jgi:DNA repair exonuclease SbcCD nuclease subunit
MVPLIFRTDLHLADAPPASRTDDWTATCARKLAEVGEIARQENACAVLDGGDHFHLKSPGRNSHSLVQLDADIHAKYPCPTYGNVGNHDVKYGDMRFLDESPLGVLFSTGVFHRLYDQHEAVFTRGGVKVRVVGIPYHGTKYDMTRLTSIKKGDEDHLVVIAHLLASKAGGSMFEAEDVIRYHDLAGLAPDVWCFGHWHKNQHITRISDNKWVVNLGSMTRGSLTQDEMARNPAVAVMRFEKNSFDLREVPLTIVPAKEVFDVAGRVRLETRETSVDSLVGSLKLAMARRPEGSLLDEVRGRGDLPPVVRERALEYLERAGTR